MSKKKQKRHAHTVAQNEKKNNKTKLACIIAVAVVLCLLVVYLIVSAVKGNYNPTKWGEKGKEIISETEKSVICAIFYPDRQSNGDVWQTGGMEQTSAKNMREALENDFDKDFFKFADDGTIFKVGDLIAGDGYKFTIQKNTTRSPEQLSDKPEDIELADSESYEIVYRDPNGEQVCSISKETLMQILKVVSDEKGDKVEDGTDMNGESSDSEQINPYETDNTVNEQPTATEPNGQTTDNGNSEGTTPPVAVSDPTAPTDNATQTQQGTTTPTVNPTVSTDPTDTNNTTDPTTPTEDTSRPFIVDTKENDTIVDVGDFFD